MSEFRHDPITGRSVIIAAGRGKRPRSQRAHDHRSEKIAEPCPFCAGNEASTPPEIWALRKNGTSADQPGWSVRAVPNKYPALEASARGITAKQDGIYESRHGVGVHEVIVESPEHQTDMAGLDVDQWTDVLCAYRSRLAALGKDPRWRYVLLYKNQGERAGATLEHVHSQMIAMASVPASMTNEIVRAKAYQEATGRCIYCEMIQRECARGTRLVIESENFAVLCPFAARFDYETWILPRKHTAAFAQTTDREGAELACVLRTFFLRLNRALGRPPFNYVIQSMPPHENADSYFHWRMEILPQLNRAAGFEWGSGMWMNSVAPEEAARLLRDPF